MVTEPGMPCYKLGLKLGRDDIIKKFLASSRTGFYFAAVQEGDVGTEDAIQPISRDSGGVTVPNITSLYANKLRDLDLLRRAIQVEALREAWRTYFRAGLTRRRPRTAT